ncbi:hypothetical protein ACTRXD_14815 [Nitrospira sp. T9]|uniref:hypothetical protein n=1 Tax=unclassified Nitrospira TaxID=2652172 RepID=UPI003F982E0D
MGNLILRKFALEHPYYSTLPEEKNPSTWLKSFLETRPMLSNNKSITQGLTRRSILPSGG